MTSFINAHDRVENKGRRHRLFRTFLVHKRVKRVSRPPNRKWPPWSDVPPLFMRPPRCSGQRCSCRLEPGLEGAALLVSETRRRRTQQMHQTGSERWHTGSDPLPAELEDGSWLVEGRQAGWWPGSSESP